MRNVNDLNVESIILSSPWHEKGKKRGGFREEKRRVSRLGWLDDRYRMAGLLSSPT